MINKLRDAFRPDSSYKAFFVSILTFALAYGLYKGIADKIKHTPIAACLTA